MRKEWDTMAFYTIFLIVSLLVNCVLRYYKHKLEPATPSKETQHELLQRDDQVYDSDSDCSIETIDDWTIISRQYLTVYALAVGADWLQVRCYAVPPESYMISCLTSSQGSFVYALYKNDYQLSQSLVAALFATGFGSGALSATGIGYLADRFGRKKACLAYCVLYILSSALTMFHNHFALFAGRVLGGVSTTLLYSVFETWMVAKASTQENSNASIQATLTSAASINAVVAICAGFTSEVLAWVFGSKQAPFAGSIVCLVFAASIISAHWVCLSQWKTATLTPNGAVVWC